jgi:hypothetical protein
MNQMCRFCTLECSEKYAHEFTREGITMTIRNKLLTATFLLALGGFQAASAAMITTSLGNTASGFANGSIQTVPAIGTAQGGQPAPFDQGYGTDGLFGGNFSQSWTHSYGAIVDPILSASITFGIYDHDSVASGDQLSLFSVDGTDFTGILNPMFEAGGGAADSQYNEYTIDLASIFADLLDGEADISLNLQGFGLVPRAIFLGGGFEETSTNGANLIFSTLTIETQGPTIPPIPIPAAAPLFLSAIAAFGLYRRRVLRNEA